MTSRIELHQIDEVQKETSQNSAPIQKSITGAGNGLGGYDRQSKSPRIVTRRMNFEPKRGLLSEMAHSRQAQIETMAERPHPYFWSGFVLTGHGGMVECGVRCQGEAGLAWFESSSPVVQAGAGCLVVVLFMVGLVPS
ncbi:hypothetical protein QUF64_08750 [Anaerolineales bacterium HSG6]|nr:hypothetical protein [Anaerolineales bacterium HSG6]